MSFDAQATATDAPTLLSIADGDVDERLQARSHLGRLQAPSGAAGGHGRQGRVPAARRSVDPLLNALERRGDASKATVKLRQKVKGKATGNYRKLVLVTLSTETP